MSVSRIVLPVLNLEQNDNPLHKGVLKGARYVNTHKVPADSSSDSQCSFSFQPPSQNTVIDRRIDLEVVCNVISNSAIVETKTALYAAPNSAQNLGFAHMKAPLNVAAASADGTAKQPIFGICNNLAPKQFPISKCIETIDLVINGTHFTASLNQYLNAVMKYTTPEYREALFSGTAHHPDVCDPKELIGLENGMNLAQEPSRQGEEPRGVWTQQAVYSGSDATAANRKNIKYTFREPLFLSPLMAEFGHGMTNINDISLTINWASSPETKMLNFLQTTDYKSLLRENSTKVQTGAQAVPITSLVLEDGKKFASPTLYLRYFTPQNDIKIPNEIILPYKQPKINIKSVGDMTAKAVDTNALTEVAFSGDNIRLNQIPDSVYLFAKVSRATESQSDGVVFAGITNVNCEWKNMTGVLSAYSPFQLIELAQENGYDASQSEILGVNHSDGCGLVLKLNFGKDIPLDDNEAPGTRGDYNWKCEAKIYNAQSVDKAMEFHQLFEYNGHAIISPNECRVMTGVLDLADNVKAEDMGHNYTASNAKVIGGSIVGGSSVGGSIIGGGLSHLFKRAMGFGKKAMAMKDKAMELKEKFSPCVDMAKDTYAQYKTRA